MVGEAAVNLSVCEWISGCASKDCNSCFLFSRCLDMCFWMCVLDPVHLIILSIHLCLCGNNDFYLTLHVCYNKYWKQYLRLLRFQVRWANMLQILVFLDLCAAFSSKQKNNLRKRNTENHFKNMAKATFLCLLNCHYINNLLGNIRQLFVNFLFYNFSFSVIHYTTENRETCARYVRIN